MVFRKSCDFSIKDSIDVVSSGLGHVVPITRRKFNNSGLDGSEYFTSLEAMKSNNSHTIVVSATPRGILRLYSSKNLLKLALTLVIPKIQWILQLQ